MADQLTPDEEYVDVPICHQCADHIELSEIYEPTSVFDQETNEKVWPQEGSS